LANIKKAKKEASPEKTSGKMLKDEHIEKKEETKDGNEKVKHIFARSMLKDEDSDPEDNSSQKAKYSKHRKCSNEEDRHQSQSLLCIN
jgi:hypothetical protein